MEDLGVIAIDIDGILTMEIKGWGYRIYQKRTPNLSNIEMINELKNKGYHVILHTARYPVDKVVTTKWIKENKILYDEIIFGKPQADAYIDDKALPYIEPRLNEYLNYDFHHTCWRFKHGLISPDEKHPCFFCGFDISISTDDCLSCGIMPCPSCKRCLCNIPLLTYITLIRIHKKYCCNLPKFTGRIELDGFVDNTLIRNCEKTLARCKYLESL